MEQPVEGAPTDGSNQTIAERPSRSLMREDRTRLSGAGLRAFIAIAELRKISSKERLAILGSPARSSYDRWRRRALRHDEFCLAEETLRRISLVMAIHAALLVLFTDARDADEWLGRPHDAVDFGGRRPRDLLVAGECTDLMRLHRFLRAAATGHYMPPHADEASFRPYDESEIIFE